MLPHRKIGAELVTKRNDHRLNSHNRVMLGNWSQRLSTDYTCGTMSIRSASSRLMPTTRFLHRYNTMACEQTFVWACRFKKVMCAISRLHHFIFFAPVRSTGTNTLKSVTITARVPCFQKSEIVPPDHHKFIFTNCHSFCMQYKSK